MNDATDSRVVVGFDGSDDAVAAVRAAAHQAAATGSRLEVVHSYDYPFLERLDEATRTELHDRAVAVAEDGVRIARHVEGVDVHAVVVVGSPAQVLVERSRGAALLVVGHRGHHRTRHRILGSVATKCVHHAPCSVLVVRDH